ncbi:MAG: sigma-70 family RNA polymerase sigma factor [Phycisphaeraceae bacterium]|nr:sigma-70 family RNA polymerase sigma factor [Phycisphaeraceae bacterium]
MHALANASDHDPATDANRVAEWLARASAGDPAAWRAIVKEYSRRIFAMAYSLLKNRDQAEEIAQSVLAGVSVTMTSGGYTERGRFDSWLMRVAMNRIRDEARRLRRHAVATDPAVLADARTAPGEPASDRAGLEGLRRALEQLPDPDREVIMLRHHGQMGFKEMAEVLGEPVGTLLARHHRALRKLKDIMESADPGTRADPVREGTR